MVSHEEFRTGVSSLNPNIDRESIASLIDVMDKDGDGEIDYLEFAKQYGSASTAPATKKLMDQVARGKLDSQRGPTKEELDTFRNKADRGSSIGSRHTRAGFHSRDAMFKSRKVDYNKFAKDQLKDIDEKFHRSHLHLHPQLLFFNKAY